MSLSRFDHFRICQPAIPTVILDLAQPGSTESHPSARRNIEFGDAHTQIK
jgi:hypothetical protein